MRILRVFYEVISIIQVKLEVETNEMMALSKCISNYAEKSSTQKIEDEKEFSEAAQSTELALRNLKLPLWEAEKLKVSLELWRPSEKFSMHLSLQIQQAESYLMKLRAMKVRMAEEVQAKISNNLEAVFKVVRAKAVTQYMAEEAEALRKGMEIEAQI